jgi:hypothetical protein
MTERRAPIRTWALVAVAVSSAFTIGMAVWLVLILSAQDWCTRALGAAKYATGRPANAIDACFSLMNVQVDTLGKALLIVIGVQALSLLVLVVIILAGGRLSFNASRDGVSADISRDEAAQRVADAAVDEAQAVKDSGSAG